jgi:multimeric flavodoxin WrbA
MQLVAFNGSPRNKGNTHHMLKRLFGPLEAAGIDCEAIRIGGTAVRGCLACGKCFEHPGRCAQTEDPMNEWIGRMLAADAVILASPTYFANVTTEMKALIDRAGFSCVGKKLLARKPGAPVVVARRGGAMQVYNALMAFFGINEMIVPMSSYWNMGYGLAPGTVQEDAEGMRTMEKLGEQMAWLMQKLR